MAVGAIIAGIASQEYRHNVLIYAKLAKTVDASDRMFAITSAEGVKQHAIEGTSNQDGAQEARSQKHQRSKETGVSRVTANATMDGERRTRIKAEGTRWELQAVVIC